jgi:hypothetical protein
MSAFIDPDTIGHWEGSKFVFDEPITLITEDGTPRTMREIDTEGMTLAGGITKDDVIHALVNSRSSAHHDDGPAAESA